MNLELQKGSRSKILAALMFIIMAVFFVRLFYLQIIKHDYYVSVANSEQIKRLTIPAKRGLIYALDGEKPVALVMNQTVYTVFADPQMVKDDAKIIDTIKQVAGGNARANLQELLDKTDSRYQILATKVSQTQANKIKDAGLRGIGFQKETQRVYPENQLASQVLGFVDHSGVGKYGVEGYLESKLAGEDGLLQSVTDVSDVPLTIGDKNINKPAIDGENIVLSIDRNVQSKVEKALADGLARSGGDGVSAIVMNPQNGQVLAMANLPTYNPTKLSEVTDVAAFNNSVISAPYEPGSDIKAFTMAVGIDKGVVSAESTYNNTDHITVDDRVISNAARGHTGIITYQTALNWSLNTGFVTIAKMLGDGNSITRGSRDIMYDYFYNKFQLGKSTGIELDNEAAGTVISPATSEGNAVRYSNMSFGQGMDVTMIQVASAFCSVVNGGNYYKPTVIAGKIDSKGAFEPSKVADPTRTLQKTSADEVRRMTQVARSTFYTSVDKAGYFVGGKTGTSQVIENGAYSEDETVGTYLGFGGSEELSNYVIMVQVSGKHKGMSGSKDALPIFTDISNWMIDYLKLQPSA